MSRKKSCVQCRQNKSRCSLDTPCLHCHERKWDCRYDAVTTEPRWKRRPREVRPITAREASSKHPVSSKGTAGVTAMPATLDAPTPATQRHGLIGGNDQIEELLSGDLVGNQWMESLTAMTQLPWSALNPASLEEMDFQGAACTSDIPPIPPPNVITTTTNFAALTSSVLTDSIRSSGSQVATDASSCQNREPRRVDFMTQAKPTQTDEMFIRQTNLPPECTITMNIILNQILSYPSMMIKGGQLPPFIFPRCAMEGEEAYRICSSKGFHQCLPKALAICCSILQSFEVKTPQCEGFLWESISREQARFQNEVSCS
jgi:hypothetical protein